MQQIRYDSFARLLSAGEAASAGAGAHAAELQLVLGTKAAIDGDLNPLVEDRDSYELTRAELVALRKALNLKLNTSIDLLSESRDLLKRSLGKKYSTAWVGTGFNHSLEVPRTV
ncbi:MAG: hypothetical protein ACK4UN_19270, partial [Limisphaerales bacterium]